MQTLKTSVVVAFMLVAVYWAYHALNVPQPVIPSDLEQLTDIEAVDIDLGVDIPPLAPPPTISTDDPSLTVDASGAATAKLTDSPSDQGVSQSLSDLPETPVAPLPKPDPRIAGNAPDPSKSYPSTNGSDVRLPDPQSLVDLASSGNGTKPNPASKPQSISLPPPGGASANAATDPAATDKPKGTASSLKNALVTAERQVSEGRLREALFTLSIFYGSPDLTSADQTKLLDMLDHLAGEVIYSKGHFLEDAHKVARGETLKQVAEKRSVPWQLLANINQIDNPDVVLPGTELKVVSGPFRAEVNLSRSEITVFLGDLYAGRFPMTVGESPQPAEGTYSVLEKQAGHEFQTADGRMIPLGSPDNPYGDVWLDLGNRLCIHGSPSSGGDSRGGCIRLSPIDARDVFGILSQGSPVTIRR